MNTIVIFTVHKAGSMFLHRLTRQITETIGMYYYSPHFSGSPFYFPETKINNDEKYAHYFEGLTGCVGPIRRPVRLQNSVGNRYILHLRDPRDVLTSMFFSYCYSHIGIADSDRVFWIKEGIDKFVLNKADGFLEKYDIYCNDFLGKSNVTLLNMRKWLHRSKHG